MARLAKETGIFPVFEAVNGEITGVSKIRHRLAVEEYLRPQKRFSHLFGKEADPSIIQRIQQMADRNIRRYGLLEEERAS
jgi:pyruvate ferredoxin oxidoreductase beta subunit